MIHSAREPHTNLAIGLVSGAVIAYQLVLMQILSYLQWYHFAYLIISIALLGFGAAGTFLSIFKKWLLQHYPRHFAFLLFLTAINMALTSNLANSEDLRFDSYLLFFNWNAIWRMLNTSFLFFLPFFFGALAIGMAFVKNIERIGTLYFSNLLGSGLGGVIALAIMWIWEPSQLPSIVAIMPALAGVVVWPSPPGRWVKGASVTSLIFIGLSLFINPELIPSQYKSISKTLLLPEAKIIFEKNSPHGVVQVVSSPVLRFGPGASLSYQKELPIRKLVFTNGNAVGSLLKKPDIDSCSILNYTTMALPYRLRTIHNALIIHLGSGESTALALANQCQHIVAVEPNHELNQLLQSSMAAETDSIFLQPSIQLHNLEARTFLQTDTTTYELIQLPVIGNFHGTSGLNAIHAQFNLTVEAFELIWDKLTPGGMLTITCWMDYPLRNSLKITSTLIELLKKKELNHPMQNLIAIRNWNTITFVVKRTPFNDQELSAVRHFCYQMQFDPLILPDITPEERETYHELSDKSLFTYLDRLQSPRREELYKTYGFRIQPATDNQPYFHQFIRWKSIAHLTKLYGSQSLPYFELGYIIVLLTLALILILATLLILLPLGIPGWKGKNKLWSLLYFGGIGLGYMSLEILFIQQFTLYFGHPVYATAGIISVLLIFSGAGSYLSSRIKVNPKKLMLITATIALLLLTTIFGLESILQTTISFPLPGKIMLMLLITGLPGFLMGFPFPLGLNWLSKKSPVELPWAWALNGYFSVISASMAIIIAVEAGFIQVMLVACFSYFIASLANLRINT